MSDIAVTQAQGFAVAHPRVAAAHLNAADSSYTQRGNHAGVPMPQSAVNRLVLQAAGDQTADTTIETMTVRGGHPGLLGAGFVHRLSADPELAWLGWDVPQTITAWEAVAWSTAGSGYEQPHAIRLADDQVLVAYSSYTGTTTQTGYVHVRRRGTDGTWSSAVEAAADPTYSARIPWGSLCPLDSGRVLLFSWVCDQGAAKANIRVRYSDDKGDTWNLGSSFVLPSSIALTANITPKRIRAAQKGGQILLLVWVTDTGLTYDDVLYQYASDDDGATFTLVHAMAGAAASDDDGSHPDIAVAGDYFVVALHGADAGTGAYRFARTTDAFYPIVSAGIAAFDATLENITVAAAEVALAADEDGAVYFYFSQTNGEHQVMRSIDYGASWAGMSESDVAADSYGVWFYSTDSATMPRDYCAVAQRGRVLVLHQWDANPGTADYSLGCSYLGGYTDLTLPFLEQFQVDTRQAGFVVNWLPYDKPSDCGWTVLGTIGSATLASPGVLQLVTSGTSGYYRRRISSVEPVLVKSAGSVSSGTVRLAYVETDEGGGGDRWGVSVRLSTAAITLYDEIAGASVATAAVSSSTKYEVLLAVNSGGSARAWYREYSTTEERRWTALGSSTTLTSTTGVSLRTDIQWGNTDSTATSQWVSVAYTYGAYAGLGLVGGQTNPDDLFFRRWSGDWVYVSAGVRMRAEQGPTVHGDVHHTAVRYEYPVEHLLTEINPSPAAWWESEDDDSDQQFVYDFGFTNSGGPTDSVQPWSRLWCLHILRNNAPTWKIRTAAFGGSLADTYTVGCTESVGYHRQGGSVELYGGGGGADLYIAANELVGGYFVFASGEVRRIAANTEGIVIDGTSGPYWPVLELDDVDGTEDDDGVGQIIFPRVCALFTLASYYDQVALKIPATTTAEGRFQAKAHLGPVRVFGRPYSNGWSRLVEDRTGIVELRDGQRRARDNGPPRRSFSFAWSEGHHLRQAQLPDPDADSITINSQRVGLRGDTALQLHGWYQYLRGAKRPISLLPYIPADASGIAVLRSQQQRGALYGRIVSPLRWNHSVGTEALREFGRVAELVVEEEL